MVVDSKKTSIYNQLLVLIFKQSMIIVYLSLIITIYVLKFLTVTVSFHLFFPDFIHFSNKNTTIIIKIMNVYNSTSNTKLKFSRYNYYIILHFECFLINSSTSCSKAARCAARVKRTIPFNMKNHDSLSKIENKLFRNVS